MLIYVELNDQTKATELSAKTKEYTSLSKNYSETDEAPVQVNGGYFVKVAEAYGS